MMNKEDYKAMKQRDMDIALERVRNIENSTDPTVKYKDSRPIMDIKHMIESSTELYGDHTAFMMKFEKGGVYTHITYKEALADINGLGTALIAHELKDKRIAVVGENCYQWAISYLAVICGTGVVVPLDKELSAKEMQQLMFDAEVSAVIYSSKYEDRFLDMKNSGELPLKVLVNMQKKQSDEVSFSLTDMIAEGKKLIEEGDRSFLDAQIIRDEMAVLLFTSGTTGISKGVMLSHGNLVEDLMAAPTVLKVNDWDIFFSVLPLHHTYECTCGFLMPLYKGATIAYCEGLKYIQKNLAEAKPTMFLAVPLIFESLHKKIWANVRKQGKEATLKKAIKINNALRKIGIDLSNKLFKDIKAVFGGNMRMMIVGGAAINPDILQGFRDFGIMALQGYGLTECAPMGALNPDTRPKNASCGRCFPGFGIKIIDKDADGIGEVCLKGGNVMLGYYRNPEATAQVIDSEGWYHTGDLGYLDDEGYLFLTGRKKNVIITKNGKNVFPEELEYYLSNVPYVAESMVWGTDTSDGTDTLIVASVLPSWDDVNAALGRELDREDPKALEEVEKLLWTEVDKINEEVPFFKRIKKIIVRTEEFEKNSSKKIKRFVESNRG